MNTTRNTIKASLGACLAAIALAGGAHAGNPVDPCGPDDLASIPAEGFTRHVELVGDLLYVLDGAVLTQDQAGLRIFDVSDPSMPVLLGRVSTPGLATDIAVSGDRAFIADGGAGGLQVVDISDPSSPTIIGSEDSPGLASGVAVVQDTTEGIANAIVVLADGADGVRLYGIFGAGSPDSFGTINTDGIANDVLIYDSTLFVADGWNGLVAYDLTDPNNPVEAGRLATQNAAVGLAYDEDSGMLYVAEAMGGVLIAEASNPLDPQLIDEYDTPGTARGAAVYDQSLYVADGYGGLLTLRVGDPPFFGITESREIDGAAVGIALLDQINGPIAFVAANQGGVRVVNLQTCEDGCPADFAPPEGILDLADISAFIFDFGSENDPNRAEALAPPENIADLADIVAFLVSFNAGCP